MSHKGIYTALSGAIAQNQRLDTIANNIANTNTTGFKKDQQVFYEYLTANEKGSDIIKAPRVPASIESFYEMNGGDRGYVDSRGTFTDHTQGSLKQTGNPLDVAIEGAGFLEVLSPAGVRLTRNGALRVDGQGRLVTKEGFPVLRSGVGQNPAARVLNIDSRNVTISQNGEIYSGRESIGSLSVVDVGNVDALQKVGSSLYKLKPNLDPGLSLAEESKVRQGFLEGSNVNVVDEMTKMISATRVFESTQKAIQAFDGMNNKLINVVGKTN